MSELRNTEQQAQAEAEYRLLKADRLGWGQPEREEVARHVLWHNGDHRGQEPGSFRVKLLEAWARADMENAHRLAVAFPLLGEAVEISRTRGSDALAEWAGIA